MALEVWNCLISDLFSVSEFAALICYFCFCFKGCIAEIKNVRQRHFIITPNTIALKFNKIMFI